MTEAAVLGGLPSGSSSPSRRTKVCSACGKRRNRRAFDPSPGYADGLRPYCRDCGAGIRMPLSKVCRSCGRRRGKARSFRRNASASDGFRSVCVDCTRGIEEFGRDLWVEIVAGLTTAKAQRDLLRIARKPPKDGLPVVDAEPFLRWVREQVQSDSASAFARRCGMDERTVRTYLAGRWADQTKTLLGGRRVTYTGKPIERLGLAAIDRWCSAFGMSYRELYPDLDDD